MDVTVVLVDPNNARSGETRLIHTFAVYEPNGTSFQANDDDRSVHDAEDEGITWVCGHVAPDSPEGIALLAAAKLMDYE